MRMHTDCAEYMLVIAPSCLELFAQLCHSGAVKKRKSRPCGERLGGKELFWVDVPVEDTVFSIP